MGADMVTRRPRPMALTVFVIMAIATATTADVAGAAPEGDVTLRFSDVWYEIDYVPGEGFVGPTATVHFVATASNASSKPMSLRCGTEVSNSAVQRWAAPVLTPSQPLQPDESLRMRTESTAPYTGGVNWEVAVGDCATRSG